MNKEIIIFVYYYVLLYDNTEIKTIKYTSVCSYWQIVDNGLRMADKYGK
jgi:hypothetical protein